MLLLFSQETESNYDVCKYKTLGYTQVNRMSRSRRVLAIGGKH